MDPSWDVFPIKNADFPASHVSEHGGGLVGWLNQMKKRPGSDRINDI